MKKTIGILAHVDGGKTTFSEQLLYHTGVVRNPGRVDNRNTVLDSNEIEKSRGITIFADQSPFFYGENTYYLMDTPGHVDFSAETERAVMALDYAVLLIDASSGVSAHTITLFHLLKNYGKPVFFFFNKMDMEYAGLETAMASVKEKLAEDLILIGEAELDFLETNMEHPSDILEYDESNRLLEFTAERDEGFLDAYMDGSAKGSLFVETLQKLIGSRQAFVCMAGSALKDLGVKEFLKVFDWLTVTDYDEEKPFSGMVYKVRHDDGNNRITFIKALSGKLQVKEELAFAGQDGEKVLQKVNEIRSYTGERYSVRKEAVAGDLFAVTGLTLTGCGDYIGQTGKTAEFIMVPSLKAKAVAVDQTDSHTLLQKMKLLEAEDPQLSVKVEENGDICVNVMGKIQLEVLKQLIQQRFGIQIDFLPPQVMYQETIGSPVMGYGHYEPLRHYAEVNLKMEPGKRGSGITFESQCHVDTLAVNYQRLVRTHVFERTHKGILTGSPLTDVKITLVAGRAHIKHTEGGDFRESVYRGIRQGLEKAENVLLEPWYRFEIIADGEYAGRIMSDIQKRSGTFEMPEHTSSSVRICGRGPVSEFMDYSAELASFTKGGGSVSFLSDGYDICHNPEEVIKEIGYEKGADKENTSCSVFCSHGAGFTVNWDEAEQYMHCISR